MLPHSHPTPDVPCTGRRDRDAGFGLVEAVLALALVGIAMLPIMLSVMTNLKVSAQTNAVAEVETVLVNAADRVNRAGEGCDYDVYVEAAALEKGWKPEQVSAGYQHYVVTETSPIDAGTWVTGACPGPQRPDGLVQKVTITVTSPDGGITRTLVVVKSDV